MFKILHDAYCRWLDERQDPFSTKVWFGISKGLEIRVLYTRSRRWTWLVNNTVWGPELKDLERRHRAYRRRALTRQARPVIMNPVGMRLGWRDDLPALDNDEDYDPDDGFVMQSDDEIEYDDGYEGPEEPLSSEEEETGEAIKDNISANRSQDHDDPEANDSDSSLPSLDEIIRSVKSTQRRNDSLLSPKTPLATPSRAPRASRAFLTTPVSNPRSAKRGHVTDSSDEDEPDSPSIKRTKSTPRRTSKARGTNSRQSLFERSSSGKGVAPMTPTQFQIITVSSDSDDHQVNEARAKTPQSCLARMRIIDPDDGPLVPKIRADMSAKRSLT